MNSTRISPLIGILMLNTHFPRLVGDIGNRQSFHYPVLYSVVDNAVPANVINPNVALPKALADNFTSAALDLQQRGATIITTSCGFLAILQHPLGHQLDVPLITSSLVLLPLLTSLHGDCAVGIVTYDAQTLNKNHFSSSNQNSQQPYTIEGLQHQDTLRQTIASDSPNLDRACAEQEVINCVQRVQKRQPAIRAIVLECTNMSPYKQAIREQTGLAVYDIIDAIHWIVASSTT